MIERQQQLGRLLWRYDEWAGIMLICLMISHSSWSLTPSTTRRIPKASQGGRSFQNRSPMHMSEAAVNLSSDHNDAAAGLSRVRERILETSDWLTRDAVRNGIRRKKYKRKQIPETEKERRRLRLARQAEYQQVMQEAKDGSPSIWSFESLFPDPVWDETSIQRDLFQVKDQDEKTRIKKMKKGPATSPPTSFAAKGTRLEMKRPGVRDGSSSLLRWWREPSLSSSRLPYDPPKESQLREATISSTANGKEMSNNALGILAAQWAMRNATLMGGKVDRDLTRMVEDKIYGYRRTQSGEFQYETSLMGEGAVKFREGVRLGNPLRINADRLNYLAKKEFQHGRIEEAKDLYEKAVQTDPRDGRGYLGLSRCAERRRDFKLARDWLRAGIQNSASLINEDCPDAGGNPFLLQALGRLEEKRGHLAEAESLYVQAAKSRPSHAAAWVALAQLRTRKLGQTVAAGRICYETAERELIKSGRPMSSYVYTAWASLEYKGAGDVRRARELFRAALKVDPKCSAAWLQLGVMEADQENWDAAKECFEAVLKFDQRNSRVIQAYALMETKRPGGSSRKAIDLFERALKANPRDAGVLQPYALYVAELGDIDAARELLRRGTEVSKRHAPVWQAWGVLEMRYGSAEEARKIFQQGIWACAQLAGNQSGGYHCARLWQAWGVLEAREGDYAAARRCFSRALDADSRNVATVTAWTQMEEDIGNSRDARLIFETSLKKFAPGSDAKVTLWRAYELMEQRADNVDAAQQVYQRSMREAFNVQDDHTTSIVEDVKGRDSSPTNRKEKKKSDEVEVSRWSHDSSSMKGEVWMHNGSIETKIPTKTMQSKRSNTRK